MNIYKYFILGYMLKTDPKKYYYLSEIRDGLPGFLKRSKALESHVGILIDSGFLVKRTNLDFVGQVKLSKMGLAFPSITFWGFVGFIFKSIVVPIITAWLYCVLNLK